MAVRCVEDCYYVLAVPKSKTSNQHRQRSTTSALERGAGSLLCKRLRIVDGTYQANGK